MHNSIWKPKTSTRHIATQNFPFESLLTHTPPRQKSIFCLKSQTRQYCKTLFEVSRLSRFLSVVRFCSEFLTAEVCAKVRVRPQERFRPTNIGRQNKIGLCNECRMNHSSLFEKQTARNFSQSSCFLGGDLYERFRYVAVAKQNKT